MFLKLDWGIIWPIVNIVVFYLLLRKFLFGPVSEVMEKRKKMIFPDLCILPVSPLPLSARWKIREKSETPS